MNETIITTAVTTPEAKKPTKPKRTDAEKLADCYEQRDKLIEQQNNVKKKGKVIETRLSNLDDKIQEYENKELFKICKEMNITTKDIIAFLQKIPKGTTLDEIANRAFHGNTENHHF